MFFPESYEEQQERLKQKSKFGNLRTYQLLKIIIKSGDDLRQEQFAMQVISLCSQIFSTRKKLKLWLKPYEILATGPGCGIIEFLNDALSIDYIKRKLFEKN